MKKLNFAIIGCGRISYKHVEGLCENKDVAKLTATCDIKLELAEAKAKEYIEKMNDSSLNVGIYEDYKEMIEKEDIDTMLSIDKNVTNENMLSKVFGHFFDN